MPGAPIHDVHRAFNLDGTLIDSAPAILESVGAALEEVGATASRPLTQELVAPSLGRMLSDVLGVGAGISYGQGQQIHRQSLSVAAYGAWRHLQ